MTKASIEISRINAQIKVKFALIIDDPLDQNNQNKMIKTFSRSGNDYIIFSPHPFVTIDIGGSSKNKNNADWDPYNSINITQQYLHFLISALKDVLSQFTIENLFFYDKGKLILNKDVSRKILKKIIINNKYLIISPIVVYDDASQSDFEGIALMINDVSHYATMTVQEAEYLLSVLEHINMPELAMMLHISASNIKPSDDTNIALPEKTFTAGIEEIPAVDRTIRPVIQALPNLT